MILTSTESLAAWKFSPRGLGKVVRPLVAAALVPLVRQLLWDASSLMPAYRPQQNVPQVGRTGTALGDGRRPIRSLLGPIEEDAPPTAQPKAEAHESEHSTDSSVFIHNLHPNVKLITLEQDFTH